MAKFWLKMIGTSDRPCPSSWTRNCVHFRKAKPRSIHAGDRLVLYAVGGEKRVFALAIVTGEVYENGQKDWPYQMDVNYTVNLPVGSGVPIAEVNTPERDLLRSLRQFSYIELSAKEYQRAEAALRKAAGTGDAAERG